MRPEHTSRKAEERDIPALVALMTDFYAESNYPLDADWATKSFADLMRNDERGVVWLGFSESKPAGYVVLTVRHSMEFGGPCGFIDDFFVLPAFRRQGVGKSLLNALFGECRARSMPAVQVEVGSHNAAALAIYRAYGMTEGRQLLTARF